MNPTIKWFCSFNRSLRDPFPCIRTNIEDTLLLLEAARKNQIKHFLHVSTDKSMVI